MPNPEQTPEVMYLAYESTIIDYESMTVTELKEECKNRGLSGYSSLNKQELIDLLISLEE